VCLEGKEGRHRTHDATIADVKGGQTVFVGGVKSPDLMAHNVLIGAG
jgi:hypothetical protein